MALDRPRNWNPSSVRIESLTRTGPTIDPVFRVPLQQKSHPDSYDYPAQINLKRKDQDRKNRTDAGDRALTRGYIILRTKDLAPRTELPIPQKGWKVTALYAGTELEVAVDWKLEEVRYESPLRGLPLLIYCEFEMDRDRSRGQR